MAEMRTPTVEKFWIVMRGDGLCGPRLTIHNTQDEAKAEAGRLAEKEGETFVWMGVEGAFVQTQPPVVEAILIEKNVARISEDEEPLAQF